MYLEKKRVFGLIRVGLTDELRLTKNSFNVMKGLLVNPSRTDSLPIIMSKFKSPSFLCIVDSWFVKVVSFSFVTMPVYLDQ